MVASHLRGAEFGRGQVPKEGGGAMLMPAPQEGANFFGKLCVEVKDGLILLWSNPGCYD